MKKILVILTMIFAVSFVFAANGAEVLEFKGKIGFTNAEDKILAHQFLENGKKVLIIGEKNLQLWDVENNKLLNAVSHQIPQFAPRGFVSTYLLLGIPKFLDWRSFIVDKDGKWMITSEKVGTNELRSAVVRDLKDLKVIAVLDLPNVSSEYISFDENKNEILTFGVTEKTGAFARWDTEKFAQKEVFSIKEYKWHQKIRGGEKMLVGSGDTKILWTAITKEGDNLTLRDVKNGAIEKEFTAKNLKPETSFQDTTVSSDEKYLISHRNDRVFVWEIDGDGQPKFEVSNPNLKGDFSFKQIIDRKFIVVKVDEQLRIYDIEGNGQPKIAVSPQNAKEDLSFLQIIKERFVVVKAENKIRVYDTNGANTLKFEIASENPKDTMEYRGATKDGKFMAVCDDQKVLVLEVSGNGKPLYEIVRQSEKERFPAIRFFDDKNLLAVARVNRSEKKEPRTEFYDISSGKLVFDAAFQVSYGSEFTPDDKYIYQKGIGAFSVWNVAAKKYYAVPLETYTESNYDYGTMQTTSGETYNSEDAEFSPDFRYILRHGDDVTAVFDTETGKQLQVIFDAQKVKYDKQNQIKKSGLGDAGWLNGGKYVYAFDSSKFLGISKTISFWEVKK